MKRWLRENGGKKAIEKTKHPVIKNREDLRKEILAQLRYNRLLEEESSCEMPTEKEAEEYYENRPDLFKSEEMVSASHILKKASTEEEFQSAEKEIIAIRERLLGGEDFVSAFKVNQTMVEMMEIWELLEKEEWFQNLRELLFHWSLIN